MEGPEHWSTDYKAWLATRPDLADADANARLEAYHQRRIERGDFAAAALTPKLLGDMEAAVGEALAGRSFPVFMGFEGKEWKALFAAARAGMGERP